MLLQLAVESLFCHVAVQGFERCGMDGMIPLFSFGLVKFPCGIHGPPEHAPAAGDRTA